jgi:hypothetical protein
MSVAAAPASSHSPIQREIARCSPSTALECSRRPPPPLGELCYIGSLPRPRRRPGDEVQGDERYAPRRVPHGPRPRSRSNSLAEPIQNRSVDAAHGAPLTRRRIEMRIKVAIGLTLVVALGLSATATVTASAALPEIVGKEGKEIGKKKFVTKGEKAVFEAKGGTKISCTASTGTGEDTGPKSLTSTTTFSGCESASIKCKTEGAEGVKLEGTAELVYTSSTSEEGALLVKTTATTITCGTVKRTLEGSFLIPVTPNSLASALSFHASQAKGVQKPDEYVRATEKKEAESIKEVLLKLKMEKVSESVGLETTETASFEEETAFYLGPELSVQPEGLTTFTGAERKIFTIKNIGLGRVKLESQEIVNEAPAVGNFVTEYMGTFPCAMFETELAVDTACEVAVKSSGIANVTAEYKLAYGPYLFSPWLAKRKLKS